MTKTKEEPTTSTLDWERLKDLSIYRDWENFPSVDALDDAASENRLAELRGDEEMRALEFRRERTLVAGDPSELVEIDEELAELKAAQEQRRRRGELLARLRKAAERTERARKAPDLARQLEDGLERVIAAERARATALNQAEAAAGELHTIFRQYSSLPSGLQDSLPADDALGHLENRANRMIQIATRYNFRRPRRPGEMTGSGIVRRVE